MPLFRIFHFYRNYLLGLGSELDLITFHNGKRLFFVFRKIGKYTEGRGVVFTGYRCLYIGNTHAFRREQ